MRVAGFKPGFGEKVDDQFKLLRNLAEDLKVPLTHIISNSSDNNSIERTAVSAVDLIDSYILCTRLASSQLALQIEPIALNPLFDEVAHRLDGLAKNRGFKIATANKKSRLVLSDRRALTSMLSALSYSFVLTNPQNERKIIKLISKKVQGKITAGVFSDEKILSDDLNKLRALSGRASVLSSNFSFGASSGIAIADVFSRILSTEFSVAKHNYSSGFEISLIPSEQLSLIGTR